MKECKHVNTYKPNSFSFDVKVRCKDCGLVWYLPRLKYINATVKIITL